MQYGKGRQSCAEIGTLAEEWLGTEGLETGTSAIVGAENGIGTQAECLGADDGTRSTSLVGFLTGNKGEASNCP